MTVHKEDKIYYLMAILIVFCLHGNDIKISILKVSEMILLIFGILNIYRFHKITKQFLWIFSVFLIITFAHNTFMDFDTKVATNFLQMPYWCSIGRFVELFCCLSFIELVIAYFKRSSFQNSINTLCRFNIYFCIVFLGVYILKLLHIINGADVHNQIGRMTGFFNEGGPFGLLIALMIVLSSLFRRPRLEIILLLVCLFLSASKAGAMLLLFYGFYKFVTMARRTRKYKIIAVIAFVPMVVLAFWVGSLLIKQYSVSWSNQHAAYKYATTNKKDFNFNAGRIPGFYIGSEMFKKNPILGIGLGNYPVLRNKPEYRGFFPRIPVYDAMGFGGLADILVQQGIIGIFLFLYLIWKCHQKSQNWTYLLLFLAVFMCGVQLTFVYPWLLIALNEIDWLERMRTKLLLV